MSKRSLPENDSESEKSFKRSRTNIEIKIQIDNHLVTHNELLADIVIRNAEQLELASDDKIIWAQLLTHLLLLSGIEIKYTKGLITELFKHAFNANVIFVGKNITTSNDILDLTNSQESDDGEADDQQGKNEKQEKSDVESDSDGQDENDELTENDDAENVEQEENDEKETIIVEKEDEIKDGESIGSSSSCRSSPEVENNEDKRCIVHNDTVNECMLKDDDSDYNPSQVDDEESDDIPCDTEANNDLDLINDAMDKQQYKERSIEY